MPVSIPLDRICVKSGILCPRCQSRVDSGEFTDLDVKVMAALLKVESRYRDYEVRFIKSYQIDDILYVLVDAKPGIPARLGPDIRRNLEDSTGIERVIVVQYRRDKRRLIEDLIQPYRVIGLEEAYLPDGSEVVVVKVPEDARRLLESFKGRVILKLAEKLLGKQIYVEYVKEVRSEPVRPEWLGLEKPNYKSLLDRLRS